MDTQYVISVMARDRVGIVAGVTRAIHEMGGNVDAISQTVLRGYFTLILTVEFPGDGKVETIRAAVAKSGAPGELAVSVTPRVPEAAPAEARAEDHFILTIVGRDRPGVISRISVYLASRSINIVDLYCYTEGTDFVMIGEVVIPARVDIRQIQIDMEGLYAGQDLAIRLQHQDIFLATNEIEFRHKPARAR